jgi:hypothetical protein
VNVSVLNNPSEINFLPLPFTARDVFVSGNYAYVANGSGGLRVVNVLNPFAPFEVGDVSLFGYASGVSALGQYAYIAGEHGGLRLVDVEDVTGPFETADYNTPGTTLDTTIHMGYAWLADLDGGIYAVTSNLYAAGRVVDHNNVGFNGVTVKGTAGRSALSNGSGSYTMTGFMPNQTYHLTPTLAGYAFAPPNRSFTLLDNTEGLNFVILREAVTAAVMTNTQTVVSYLDVRGYQTDFDFAPGTVTQTTAVTVTPVFAAGGGNMVFAGHGFELEANQGGSPVLEFNRPVTITIAYSDLDVQWVTAESELLLMWWDGTDWVDAAETCSPASVYGRDLVNNVISVGVCRSGRFGLFGEGIRVFLPVGFKG